MISSLLRDDNRQRYKDFGCRISDFGFINGFRFMNWELVGKFPKSEKTGSEGAKSKKVKGQNKPGKLLSSMNHEL